MARSRRRSPLVSRDVALSGSAAPGELGAGSGVDILVTFARAATFDGYTDLKAFLEDLLGRSVDLVTSGALKPALRSRIARDLVHVA